jgi:hypothetical protein
MTRRFAPWLAMTALILQAALPATASARVSERAMADVLVICTAVGLMTIPGGTLPAGKTERTGMGQGGGCHAYCPCSGARRRQGRRTPLTGR